MPFRDDVPQARHDINPSALHTLRATPSTVHWGFFDASLTVPGTRQQGTSDDLSNQRRRPYRRGTVCLMSSVLFHMIVGAPEARAGCPPTAMASALQCNSPLRAAMPRNFRPSAFP
jgi:hypothetical protein